MTLLRSQKGRKHDDSIVKTWYNDADHGMTVIYGVIETIVAHSLYPGGPRDIFLECEWLETVPENEQDDNVFMPQIRFNPSSHFNQRARFVPLQHCAAYNIMIARHDPWD